MLDHRFKVYIGIAVIGLAVILFLLALINFMASKQSDAGINIEDIVFDQDTIIRHPLNGLILSAEADFYSVSIMIDNAANTRPQVGLKNADIIYEALAEGSITRLLAIFSSDHSIARVGPVRSARNYYMDWAEEYGGIYMHVGGSPEALSKIGKYDFVNIDQIGAGEIYFWRDDNIDVPHNVFSSSANWRRVGDLRDLGVVDFAPWNFVDTTSTRSSLADQIVVDFSNDTYLVRWQFNEALGVYQRWQANEKFIYNTGEQVKADNLIVQIADSVIIDAKDRRRIDTQSGGDVLVFNKLGIGEGTWRVVGGRTKWFDSMGQELKLVPGKTWVEVIPSRAILNFDKI